MKYRWNCDKIKQKDNRKKGIFGKIFGYGQIVITTSSGGYNFRCIGHPDTFRSAVMNQIDAFDEERIRKQAEQMANAMKQ